MFSAQEELDRLRPELRYLRVRVSRLERANQSLRAHIDELGKENGRLRKEYNGLKHENGKIKKDIAEIKEETEKIKKERDTCKGMIFKPHVRGKLTSDKKNRQLGGQPGHKGFGRRLPQRIDRSVRVFLKCCPHCHSSLKRSDTFETHTIEDIPNFKEVKTVITRYKMERQWCNSCHKEVVGKPAQVVPHSRLGLNLIIQILIFKYVCRMSLEVMVTAFFQTYGVKVTGGGITDLLKRTKDWFGQKEYGNLLKAIRGSPIKHADETGWRINGINGWLWAFVTKQEVYYTIEETRGSGVARKVLEGSSKDDVLIRDDYSAYKNLPLKQQSCLVHLLRKSKEEVTQKNPSKQMVTLHTRLRRMYQELEEIICQPFDLKIRLAAYQYYSTEVKTLINTKFTAKDAKRIQTRITRQGTNLITALLYDDVPLTNNAAERAIRPAAVVRKISGGSRSNTGAETFAINFSVIQTIRMRNQPLIPALQNLLLKSITGKL